MNLTIQLQSARIRNALFGAAALLVLAHSAGLGIAWLTGHDRLMGLIPLFRLNHENNIPTWFASFVLLTVSALALFISFNERNREGRFWKHWFSIGVVFLLFSIDETASIHELLNTPLRLLTGASGIWYFAWVIPAWGLIALAGVAYTRWFLALPRRVGGIVGAAAALFVGGAVVMEMMGSFVSTARLGAPLYNFVATVEETLELAGAIAFVYGFAVHAEGLGCTLTVSCGEPVARDRLIAGRPATSASREPADGSCRPVCSE